MIGCSHTPPSEVKLKSIVYAEGSSYPMRNASCSFLATVPMNWQKQVASAHVDTVPEGDIYKRIKQHKHLEFKNLVPVVLSFLESEIMGRVHKHFETLL